MTPTPDSRANGISTRDYCMMLPLQRLSHEARGLLLLLPATGLVAVPYRMEKGGGWTVVVIDGGAVYRRGGHNLFVSRDEIETALELSVGDPVDTRVVHTREEADTLSAGDVILTAATLPEDGGACFTSGRAWRKEIRNGATVWTSFLCEPFTTDQLREDQFPAKVIAAGVRDTGHARA
ncbi:hypothetical protein ACQCSX_22585 (plasmid) [Pseudarthrobacter sp. P1]|uniref:hypothetical protein n=1 Tax=Pseudarthrobacter sp. P1 TaxID=3418418 RepID=UPI003CF8F718